MAVSTVIAGSRPQHLIARAGDSPSPGRGLALDWANGQAIALSGASAQSTAFDTVYARTVMVSVGGASTVGGCWISVGTNPTASGTVAGSQWISQSAEPVPVYVGPGMLIAGVQGGTAGTLSMIPALLSGA
jgi:hypothetical protein